VRCDERTERPSEADTEEAIAMSQMISGIVAVAIASTLLLAHDVSSGGAVAQDAKTFAPNSTMEKIRKRGKFVVGTRFDQPNVAQMDPATGTIQGFDADIARLIAKRLGLPADAIEFTEVISANREPSLSQGLVDIVVSGYVITDKRRSIVGQAGPYAIAHQRLFVHKDVADQFKKPEDIKGRTVCAPATSTAVPIIKKFGGSFVPIDDNSACNQQVVNKLVDGKMGNDLLTVGFLKQYPGLALSSIPNMSDEGWGIGLAKDDKPFCEFLIESLREANSSGEWQRLWDVHLAPLGLPAQSPPTLDGHC
jgi:glutamate transport system substrate-binding protein